MINCGKCGKFVPKTNKEFCKRSCQLSFGAAIKKSVVRSPKTNTIYAQKSELDQFYTDPKIAELCLSQLWDTFDKNEFDLFLEPSAGTGSFFDFLPKSKRVGLDLAPKGNEIIKMDFFAYDPPASKKIITIGNPPFGRVCSTAIKFFNAAAKFSSVIAFIIPRTFQKQSLQNKLDLDFRLVSSTDLPKNSFIFNGEPYDVPCCFQIWEKSKVPRSPRKINLENNYFEFVVKNDADFAVRRVGGRTGKASLDVSDLSETSHYFLRAKPLYSKEEIVKVINDIDFRIIIGATAGVKSLSKPEFVGEFLDYMKKSNNDL